MRIKTIQEVKAEVNRSRDELIKTLQNYCRSQVDLWRQVSALARRADGLKGHTSGRYQYAYLIGCWPISQTNFSGLGVDLTTGELGPDQLLQSIQLDQVDSILQKIDAGEVIRELMHEITKPLSAIA